MKMRKYMNFLLSGQPHNIVNGRISISYLIPYTST